MLALFIDRSSSQNYKSYAIVITFSQYNLHEQCLEQKPLPTWLKTSVSASFSHLEQFYLPSIMMIDRRRERVENRKSLQLYDNLNELPEAIEFRSWLFSFQLSVPKTIEKESEV